MKAIKPLMLVVLLMFVNSAMAAGSNSGAGEIKKFAWFTSDTVVTTTSVDFIDMPETFVTFTTRGQARDLIIHFCGQLDHLAGGRTQLRISLDSGLLAEPNLAPGPILAWDSFEPLTECMVWIAPAVEAGEHIISVQWAHEFGDAGSRVSYRTLVVYH